MSHCCRDSDSDSDWNTVCGHSRASKKNIKLVWRETKRSASKYAKLGSFEKIYASLRKRWRKGNSGIRGVGPLTCYDLCVHICKNYNISLNGRVWLMGPGPVEAGKRLKIWKGTVECKKCKITNEVYVMIKDVRAAFQKSKYEYDKEKVENGAGGFDEADDMESYLCCWQR